MPCPLTPGSRRSWHNRAAATLDDASETAAGPAEQAVPWPLAERSRHGYEV